MKRILIVVFSLLISCLGYSQVTSYSYTIKLGPANNQVSVYAKPVGSGSVRWSQLEFVIGFKTADGVPSGTWEMAPAIGSMFNVSWLHTAENKGTSINPAGYSYISYSFNHDPATVAIEADIIDGTEYLVGTITYSNLPGGVPFTPYLLDFADGGSTGDANTYIGDPINNGTYYTPTYGNASFYGAVNGGYKNSGSVLVDIGAGNSAATPTISLLPLKLLSFAAKQSNSASLLDWTVSEQQNTSSFIVERSTDGKNYSKIGTVAAAGNYAGKQTYSFTDANAATGTNYYRLKMVDIDGKFTYSPIRTVNFNTTATGLQIIPNPTQNVCYIKGLTKPAVIKLFDMNGKVLQVQNEVSSNSPINVASLPAGVYLVQVLEQQQVSGVYKLVKE